MVDGAGGGGGAVVGEGLAADGGEVAAGGGGAAVHCTSTAPAAVIAASVAAIGCPRRSRERSGGWRPGRECAARLVSSYSSRHVRVNGDCNVMDEPRVPLLVRLQVRGQGMTVWTLLRGGGLVLGLLHGAAPPRKWVFLHRGTNQTPRPLSGVQRRGYASPERGWRAARFRPGRRRAGAGRCRWHCPAARRGDIDLVVLGDQPLEPGDAATVAVDGDLDKARRAASLIIRDTVAHHGAVGHAGTLRVPAPREGLVCPRRRSDRTPFAKGTLTRARSSSRVGIERRPTR